MANDPNVRVRLTTQNEVKTGLAAAESEIKSFSENVKGLMSNAFVVAGAAIGAMGASLKRIIDHAADLAVELGKTSASTGISVDRLSELSDAATYSSVPVENLQVGFKMLAMAMSDSHMQGGQALKAMGIDVASFHGDVNAMFTEISKKFAGYKDGAEKSALATQIFGRSGTTLIPLMDHLASTTKTVDQLGASMTAQQQSSLQDYDEKMKKLKLATTGFTRQIALAAVPALDALADAFTVQIGQSEKFNVVAEVVGGTMRFITVVILAVKDAFVLTSDVVVAAMMAVLHSVTGVSNAVNDLARGHFVDAGKAIIQVGHNVASDWHTMTESMKTDGYNAASEIMNVLANVQTAADKHKTVNFQSAPSVGNALTSTTALHTKEAEEKASYDRQLLLAKGNYAQIEKLDEAHLAFLRKYNKEESVVVQNALAEQIRHRQEANAQIEADKKKSDAKVLEQEIKEQDKEKAVWEAKYNLQLKQANGNYEMIHALELKHLAQIKILYGEQSAEYIKMQEQILATTQQYTKTSAKTQLVAAHDVTNGMEQILAAGFAKGGTIGSAAKEGEKLVLGLLGNIMKKQGEAYLTQGTTMTALAAGLSNPITAGPAALAIGAALVALGSMLGAIDSGGNGGSGRGGAGGAISSGGINNTMNALQGVKGLTTINITGGILDMSNPVQQKAFATAMQQITGRKIVVQTS